MTIEVKKNRMAEVLELHAIFGQLGISVGSQGPEGAAQHPDAEHLTVAQLASYHEYGTEELEAKRWIKRGLNPKGVASVKRRALKGAVKSVSNGAPPRAEAIAAGEKVARYALKRIKRSRRAPKESGAIRASLSWRVLLDGAVVSEGDDV